MKATRVIAIALAAVAVCGGLWSLWGHRPPPVTTPALPAPTPAPRRIRRATTRRAIPLDLRTSDSTNDSTQPVTGAQTETNRLTRAEINAYLTLKKRGADSLITAYSLTDDTNFLKEAAERYPDNLHVQLAVLCANLFPEDRWHWLEAFKQNAPDNPLASYLAAREYFKAGQPDQAIAELTEAGGKSAMETYWLDMAQARADAYKSAGFADADAAWVGYFDNPWPWMKDLRHVADDLVALAVQTRENGDIQAANALVTMGMTYGERIATGDSDKLWTCQFIGMYFELKLLGSLDASVPVEYDGVTQSAGDRLAALIARLHALQELEEVNLNIVFSHALSDDDTLAFFDHFRAEGELVALQWLRDKLGPNLPTQPQPSASERK